VQVSLIQVPYMLADPRHPAAEGPRRYLEGGAATLLEDQGHDIAVELVERAGAGPFPDQPSASLAVNSALAGIVRQSVAADVCPSSSRAPAMRAWASSPASNTRPAA
jgi:hypothetical protein